MTRAGLGAPEDQGAHQQGQGQQGRPAQVAAPQGLPPVGIERSLKQVEDRTDRRIGQGALQGLACQGLSRPGADHGGHQVGLAGEGQATAAHGGEAAELRRDDDRAPIRILWRFGQGQAVGNDQVRGDPMQGRAVEPGLHTGSRHHRRQPLAIGLGLTQRQMRPGRAGHLVLQLRQGRRAGLGLRRGLDRNPADQNLGARDDQDIAHGGQGRGLLHRQDAAPHHRSELVEDQIGRLGVRRGAGEDDASSVHSS